MERVQKERLIMALGKIYYLASVFDKINKLGLVFFILSIAALLSVMVFYSNVIYASREEKRLWKKITKITGVVLCLSTLLAIVIPSRDDFLIISLTKDYTPQQIYKMTKEEMKNGVDYLIKQIKEIKQ